MGLCLVLECLFYILVIKYLCRKKQRYFFISISVDTINLRFNVKPDYDQQQLQEDLKNGQKELEKTRKAMDKLAKNGLNAMTKEERAHTGTDLK